MDLLEFSARTLKLRERSYDHSVVTNLLSIMVGSTDGSRRQTQRQRAQQSGSDEYTEIDSETAENAWRLEWVLIHRLESVPAKRGKGVNRIANTEVRSPAERRVAMSWAQRLKRVFNIDMEVCGRCGGSVKVIACIEDQDIIDRILAHLREKEQERPCPAPPGAPNQGATCQAVSFRRKRIPNPTSAKTPLKKPWHGLLRALVQEWADMNCTINSASNFSGLQAGISPISLVQLAGSVRKFNLNRPFILPILGMRFV